jgi:hypothetical protein
VELLLDRGLGRAGVAMSPAPPKGIIALPFSTLKAASPALAHPSKWHGMVTLTPEEFTYASKREYLEEFVKPFGSRFKASERLCPTNIRSVHADGEHLAQRAPDTRSARRACGTLIRGRRGCGP